MALSPRLKRISTGISLALMSLCIAILLLEAVTRLLPLPYDKNLGEFYACHNELGWTGAPNFQGIIEDPAFRQQITLNSLGMHDTDHNPDKTASTFRILMLGDSFIQAVQVDETATAHQILEDNLNAQAGLGSKRFEVLSSGVINWGTNQQLIYYREQGRQFHPDLVLLAFYIGNDFADNLPGNVLTSKGFNCYAPYFAVCDGEINPSPLSYAPGISHLHNNCSAARRTVINGMGRLYQHSRLYQQLEPLIVGKVPRQQFGDSYPLDFTPLYLPDEQAELSQAWQITSATITQLEQEIRANGSRFGVILISPDIIIRLGKLTPTEQAQFLSDNPIFAGAELDRPNQRLADFFTKQNIPFIDLTQPMIEHWATNGSPLYLLGEGHWTVDGNRLAADLVSQWLDQASLLSQNIR